MQSMGWAEEPAPPNFPAPHFPCSNNAGAQVHLLTHTGAGAVGLSALSGKQRCRLSAFGVRLHRLTIASDQPPVELD